MSRLLAYLLLVPCLLLASSSQAQEPRNLQYAKQELVKYYASHEYERDVSKVIASALRYLQLGMEHPIASNKPPAIVLDIDETALSNYSHIVHMNFGGSVSDWKQAEIAADDPALEPTLKLYHYARAHHIAVIFLTGRSESSRTSTISNLRAAGYKDFDAIFFRTAEDKNKSAASYKTAIRKQLSQRYNILLNIGDQISDLAGGYARKTFKLPNPFYYIA